ncbi:hypothetical protein R1flu_018523 [Riccia fluitans]|uniref:Uncharacterized protein n=1 Tax=Riccia fluitans TaxID=41844 RepID=A0ABD1ZGD8_9MARC
MEIQRGWGVRLTNIPQGLDILVRIDEERRELRMEFEERVVEKKGESSRRRSGPSSPLPKENFYFTCGARGLPKEHKCEEIASLLASVVGHLENE